MRAHLGIRAEPARPFLTGIFGVARAHEELQSGVSRCARRFGFAFFRVSWRRTPPIQAAPLRKKLCVERTRLVRALWFVIGAERKNFSGIGGAQKEFAIGSADNSGNLRGASFGQLREYAVTIDSQQRAAVTRAGKKAAVRSKRERIDHVLSRVPQFFRRAIGGDAVDGTGKLLREGNKRGLALRLASA